MRFLFLSCILLCAQGYAQSLMNVSSFLKSIGENGAIPDKILSGRSVVLYSEQITADEINEVNHSFQQTGIDAVAYFEASRLFGGQEVSDTYAAYFTKREITILIFLTKDPDYHVLIVPFNNKNTFTNTGTAGWGYHDKSLALLLKEVYRTAARTYKKENFLINDLPEKNISVSLLSSPDKRRESFPYDLKVDGLAVPLTGDSAMNNGIREVFKNYPFKYKLVDSSPDEEKLRSEGYLYIMYFVLGKSPLAKEWLDYPFNSAESASASVTFPTKEPQLKNIPISTPIYKAYVKQITTGALYVGTKWDGDVTLEQAIRNYILGLKWELRID